MATTHQVHNLIILDESGSMESIKDFVIAGFNELAQHVKNVQEQFPDQEHIISLVSFNGSGLKEIHWRNTVSDLGEINGELYRPDDMTPLYDAMGLSINKLKNQLRGSGPHHVLVTVFTDGEENASREYSAHQIRKMVEDLEKNGWTFTYVGTEHDVIKAAVTISIKNVMRFEKNSEGLKEIFEKEKSARTRYSNNISKNADTQNDFYREDDKGLKN